MLTGFNGICIAFFLPRALIFSFQEFVGAKSDKFLGQHKVFDDPGQPPRLVVVQHVARIFHPRFMKVAERALAFRELFRRVFQIAGARGFARKNP